MSITSSIEPYANISSPMPFFGPQPFEAEEETVVPRHSLGYTNPPAPLSIDGDDEEAQQNRLDAEIHEDEAVYDAAVGAYRRQILLATLAFLGLALGMATALLV